jgi:multiple sugar transport system substrate-binding protein
MATAAVTALLLAACGSTGEAQPTGTAGGESSDATTSTPCEPAPAGTKVTLKYNSWVPGFQAVVDLWNKENPDIQVEYSNVPDGTSGTYANYFNQVKAGTAPDLGFMDYSATPSFVTQDALVDISNCPGVKEGLGKYLPWTASMSQLGAPGVQYGIPQDVGTMGIFYRKDLFEKAGINYPQTWDEFYEAAKKVRASGGYILNIGSYSAPQIMGLAWQHGAKWFGIEGDAWKVAMTDPATTDVANLIQKLIDEKLVTTYPPSGDAYNKAMADGSLWGTLLGAWGGYYVKTGAPDTSGGWAVGLMPQWAAGEQSAASWGGANLVVLKGSKYPAEAVKFALWATSNTDAVTLNVKNGGIFPATADAATTIPQLTEPDPFFGGQVTSDVFSQAGSWVPAWTFGPVQVSTEAVINDGMAEVIAGNKTVIEVLTEAQTKTIDDMKAQGLPVS